MGGLGNKASQNCPVGIGKYALYLFTCTLDMYPVRAVRAVLQCVASKSVQFAMRPIACNCLVRNAGTVALDVFSCA